MNAVKFWWTIDNVVDKITDWSLFISIFSIMFMMVLATVDIIATKFFNFPIPGTSGLIEDFNLPLVYMGMAYVQLNRGHITGGIFENTFSKRVKKVITIVGYLIGFLVCGIICWRQVPLIVQMVTRIQLKTGHVQYPLWPFAVTTCFGFGLLAISYILSIRRSFVKSNN